MVYKLLFEHVRCAMANILKQVIEGNLDTEAVKRKLCDAKLQVSLSFFDWLYKGRLIQNTATFGYFCYSNHIIDYMLISHPSYSYGPQN